MISAFYRKYSGRILLTVLVTLAPAAWYAETIPCNNDIETWLPDNSSARAEYQQFQHIFGADESIAIGYQREMLEPQQVAALSSRIAGLKGVQHSWTSDEFQSLLTQLRVSKEEARARVTRLTQSEDGRYNAILIVLNEWGLKNRSELVASIRAQLDYAELDQSRIALAGAPVVVTELDRLGNRDNNKWFFILTLLVCLGLLQKSLKSWRLSLSIVGLTIWGIDVTLGLLHFVGVDMNFILSALPVLVMVFTLAVSIHFLHNFNDAWQSEDPLAEAFHTLWKPAVLATITTVIGLVSLGVSSIGPVRQFGMAAAFGSVVALVAGLGILPAILVWFGYQPQPPSQKQISVYRVAWGFLTNARTVTLAVTAVVLVCAIGLPSLSSKIDPIDFLPKGSAVLSDVKEIESRLTKSDSIELLVDFENSDKGFFERLSTVKRIQDVVAEHKSIGHTLSLATFMPAEMLNGSTPSASLIASARNKHDDTTFLADGERYWRISARISSDSTANTDQIVDDIRRMTAGDPVVVTGLTPVLDAAQTAIFAGFWESFGMAFALISLVMLVALRSVKAGLLAMVPNLTPICIVFGLLGWIGIPVDIGTMMTASIALGLAVDGTFHFLFAHYRIAETTGDKLKCTHQALCRTGVPIMQAAVISAVGMLALTFSNFNPTVKFGWLMSALLMTALVGDLVLLPAILAFGAKHESKPTPDTQPNPPHCMPAPATYVPHPETAVARQRPAAPGWG